MDASLSAHEDGNREGDGCDNTRHETSDDKENVVDDAAEEEEQTGEEGQGPAEDEEENGEDGEEDEDGEEGEEGEEGEDGEEDEEDEEEEDEESHTQDETQTHKQQRTSSRASIIRKHRSAKSKGYRRLSMIRLTGNKQGSLNSHNRNADPDVLCDVPCARSPSVNGYANAITLNSINRLCRFVPENIKSTTYTEEEFKLRTELHHESIGKEVANIIRANVEPVAHKILTAAILSRLDSGSVPRISAYDIHAATRALEPQLDFTASFPMGLIRNAQITPEPKFRKVEKLINGKRKWVNEHRDTSKKIIDVTSNDYDVQKSELALAKKLRSFSSKKAGEAKVKTRKVQAPPKSPAMDERVAIEKTTKKGAEQVAPLTQDTSS